MFFWTTSAVPPCRLYSRPARSPDQRQHRGADRESEQSEKSESLKQQIEAAVTAARKLAHVIISISLLILLSGAPASVGPLTAVTTYWRRTLICAAHKELALAFTATSRAPCAAGCHVLIPDKRAFSGPSAKPACQIAAWQMRPDKQHGVGAQPPDCASCIAIDSVRRSNAPSGRGARQITRA